MTRGRWTAWGFSLVLLLRVAVGCSLVEGIDVYVVGYLTSSFTSQGVTCTVYRVEIRRGLTLWVRADPSAGQ